MLDRFKEPSSYAGIAATAAAVLPNLAVPQPIIGFITAFFGIIAFFLRDKK